MLPRDEEAADLVEAIAMLDGDAGALGGGRPILRPFAALLQTCAAGGAVGAKAAGLVQANRSPVPCPRSLSPTPELALSPSSDPVNTRCL